MLLEVLLLLYLNYTAHFIEKSWVWPGENVVLSHDLEQFQYIEPHTYFWRNIQESKRYRSDAMNCKSLLENQVMLQDRHLIVQESRTKQMKAKQTKPNKQTKKPKPCKFLLIIFRASVRSWVVISGNVFIFVLLAISDIHDSKSHSGPKSKCLNHSKYCFKEEY